tara:strand:+ start:3560 stop:4657 length:1098 start_codon:yes stop_codon:yes gene_type:complete
MDDLLKEAIADAKVVRDTAVENARLALAEAFTPKIQSMLTQKIRQEVEDENQEDEMKDEAMDDEVEDEGEEKKEGYGDEGEHEDEGEEVKEIEDEVEDEGEEVEEVHDEVEDEDEEVAEIEDEGEHDDEDDDLDLESILRELEKEVEDEDDEVEEVSHADEDEELEEELKSSDVGAADNKLDKDAESSSDIGKADKAKHTEGVEDEGEHDDEEVDEDIDLEEILKALSEVEDEDEEVEENVEEITQLKSELEEYRNAVKYMRGKLNEVNLLNAKLLFTNKLFRAFGLSEGDKYRVVETFDRAKNLREVKLVYATLAESFGQKPKIQESKGKSSKPVASTKPKNESKVISEGTDLKNRFKKLANII